MSWGVRRRGQEARRKAQLGTPGFLPPPRAVITSPKFRRSANQSQNSQGWPFSRQRRGPKLALDKETEARLDGEPSGASAGPPCPGHYASGSRGHSSRSPVCALGQRQLALNASLPCLIQQPRVTGGC